MKLNNLHPVLRRLQKDGYLTNYDQPFQGRNRRYYSVTPQGREQFLQFYEQWKHFRGKIDDIMDGGMNR